MEDNLGLYDGPVYGARRPGSPDVTAGHLQDTRPCLFGLVSLQASAPLVWLLGFPRGQIYVRWIHLKEHGRKEVGIEAESVIPGMILCGQRLAGLSARDY